MDASTTVDYPAFEAVELPRDMDGNQLSCPSLSGLIAQAADIAATSRRRRYVRLTPAVVLASADLAAACFAQACVRP